MTFRKIALGMLLAFCAKGAVAQQALSPMPVPSLPARIELHPVPTLTLPDAAFLKGDRTAGQATTLAGELRIAQGEGRQPAVILLHGSGGLGSAADMWARDFAEIGVSTFLLDYFTGRGLASVSADQSRLGRLQAILDAYQALAILAKHPRIDPNRIALIGFSRGGQATLYASLQRFHGMWNQSGADFAAYLPFYPDCMTTFVDDTKIKPVPVRMFHGAADDYNPAPQCTAFMERLKAAGVDVTQTLYPGASHSFDSPTGANPATVSAASQTVRNCRLREEPLGQLVNAQGAPFTYKDPCVELGPHLGYHPEASLAARAAVRAFLKERFKL